MLLTVTHSNCCEKKWNTKSISKPEIELGIVGGKMSSSKKIGTEMTEEKDVEQEMTYEELLESSEYTKQFTSAQVMIQMWNACIFCNLCQKKIWTDQSFKRSVHKS